MLVPRGFQRSSKEFVASQRDGLSRSVILIVSGYMF